jgi:hypothetical protein
VEAVRVAREKMDRVLAVTVVLDYMGWAVEVVEERELIIVPVLVPMVGELVDFSLMF